MNIRNRQLAPIMVCLSLTILTSFVFWSLKDSGFINIDDDIYVYKNAYVQSGLNWNSIKHAFASELVEKSANWHPLTWLSLMLDYQFFGLNPRGYHLINLFLHIAGTVLLFLFFQRATKAIWPSTFVAALFAVHPLHVESVAWIAERKDVLSTFFWMLTMGAYVYYVKERNVLRFSIVSVVFALGLMAKPMLVNLPIVLLLLDYWPLQRFREENKDQEIPRAADRQTEASKGKKGPAKKNMARGRSPIQKRPDNIGKRSHIYPLFWEKIPLFLLAAISGIITLVAQQKGGAIQSLEAYPIAVRLGNALISYVLYIGKTLWPVNLAVYYPHPEELIPWQVLGAALLLITITAAVSWRGKNAPYLLTGWLWYVVTLVPVIGIVQVGSQAMADRYTYVPLIGLFIITAWGIPDILKKLPYRKTMLLTLSLLSITALSIVAWKQVGYWQNSITLMNQALKATDYKNIAAYNNLGVAYADLGNYQQAIEYYRRAIEIKPGYAKSYYNRGNAYAVLGEYRKAIEDYSRAMDIKPGYAEAYYNRGKSYAGLGEYRQAMEDFGQAIAVKPDYVEIYLTRGNTYAGLGEYRKAIEDYSRAIAIKPDYARSYYNRGVAYTVLGDYRQAVEDYSRAIAVKSDYAEAHNNRGTLWNRLGDRQQAIADYNRAIAIKPDYAEAYNNRGNAYAGLGDYQQAIADYNRAIASKPGYAEAYFNRGSVHVRIGDSDKSLSDLQAAVKLGSERARQIMRNQKPH